MLPALELIPERRRKLGLTQSQLADLAGVSQSYIAKLEAGNIEPSYKKVKALFETLDKLEQEKQISASALMSKTVVSVQMNGTVQEAIDIMRRTGFSQLPVLDGGKPVGSISEGTIMNQLLTKGDSHSKHVDEIMEESFPLVSEEAPVSLLVSLLRFYPAALVQRKGEVLGIITKADLLGAI